MNCRHYPTHPAQMDFTNLEYLNTPDSTILMKNVYNLLTTQHNVIDKLKSYSPILVGTIPIQIDIMNSDLDIILTVPTCQSDNKTNRSDTTDSGRDKYDLDQDLSNFTTLQEHLSHQFGHFQNFSSSIQQFQGQTILMCSFFLPNLDFTHRSDDLYRNSNDTSQIREFYEVEIFASTTPTTLQNGYLHMLREYELLWFNENAQILYNTITNHNINESCSNNPIEFVTNGDKIQFFPNFRQLVINMKKNGIKTEPTFAKLLGLTGNPYIALLEYLVPLKNL